MFQKILIFAICQLAITHSYSQTWEEIALLRQEHTKSNNEFGFAVSLDSSYGIIGAIGEDTDADGLNELYDSGAAYIIGLGESEKWEIKQKISASDRSNNDKFGSSVSITKEWLVVGAPYHNCMSCEGFGSLAGAVYLFRMEKENVWKESQILTPKNHQALIEFGNSVAIKDSLLVVGAFKADHVSAYRAGAAYVFKLNSRGEWHEVQKIQAGEPSYQSRFGYSVAIGNGKIFVGAPYDGVENEDDYGAVYTFTKNPSNLQWTEESKLVPDIRVPKENFGVSIATSGNTTIIGNGGVNMAKVYIFEYNNQTWTLSETLTPESNAGNFGKSLSIDGNYVVVGDSKGNGLAYVYEKKSSGRWEETFKIYPSDPTLYETDHFANSVSLYEGKVLIGSSNKEFNDANAGFTKYRVGSAYLYSATDIPYAFEESSWLEFTEFKGTHPKLIDYDNDGDLDLFLSYRKDANTTESRLYENDKMIFTPIDQKFPHLTSEDFSSWININGDLLLDLLVSNQSGFTGYLNNGDKTFEEIELSFPFFQNYWQGGFHFADFDNDSDLDILLQGYNEYPYKIKIIENEGMFEFKDSGLEFDGWLKSTDPWIDYNTDGFVDFIAMTKFDCDTYELIIYENNGNKTFNKIGTGLRGLNTDVLNYSGDTRWGDFENDGDLDLVIAGQNGCSTGKGFSGLYLNNGNGQFYSSNENFGDIVRSVDLCLGDFNNDGQLDIFSYGEKASAGSKTELLVNRGKDLVPFEIRELLQSSQFGGIEAGDVDGDGDLDIVIAGQKNFSSPKTAFYKNNSTEGWSFPNQPPSPPKNLLAQVTENQVKLSWSSASDDKTPTASISYNFYLYRNDTLLIDAYSNLSGVRKLAKMGNVYFNKSHILSNLKDGFYRWSVQAIDQSFQGSDFTEENTFRIGNRIVGTHHTTNYKIEAYPNPTNDYLYLKHSNGKILKLTIADISGKLLFEGIYQNEPISLMTFKSGIYMLNIIDSSDSKQITIIKK